MRALKDLGLDVAKGTVSTEGSVKQTKFYLTRLWVILFLKFFHLSYCLMWLLDSPLVIQICHLTCCLPACFFFYVFTISFLYFGEYHKLYEWAQFFSFFCFWCPNSKRKEIVIPWTILNKIYKSSMLTKGDIKDGSRKCMTPHTLYITLLVLKNLKLPKA